MVLALCMAVLTACSSIKLGYNGAATFSYWWLDRYLDFDRDQASRVREDLQALERWHRSTQLPSYAELMQRTQALAASPSITAAQACEVVDEAQRQLDTLAAHAVQRAVPVARTLTPAQVNHLQQRYAKLNQEFREEWIAPTAAKVQDKRYEKALERAERIYGRLDQPQREVLRQQTLASVFDAHLVDAERRRRQEDTLKTLRALAGGHATDAEANQALTALVMRWRTSPQPQYRAYSQRQMADACETAAQLHNAATPAQRAHAQRRLKDYERDLRELSAQL